MPDDDLRVLGRGRILVGGAPLRILRLSEPGARTVRALFRGEPVGEQPGRQRLARRLLDGGLAHPVPPPWPESDRPTVAVVIPVRDDPAGAARTLDALVGPPRTVGVAGGDGTADRPASEVVVAVIVVDDGSADHAGLVAAVAGRARLILRPVSGGPGVARMTGTANTTAEVLAFVDAGVELAAGGLDRLIDHLADPAVVAAAPRVASTPGPGRLARYEEANSPLDLGRRPAPARPGSPVPYVPTACLVVRREGLVDVGGFDPVLRYGEDVDLSWRLAAASRHVRYDPSVVASHPPRSTLRAWWRQRVSYGSSAGPLARRHGGLVAPSRGSAWSLAVWGLAVVAGRPVTAAALAAWTARSLRSQLGSLPDPGAEAVRLAVSGHWWSARNLSHQMVRTWWPVTVALLALPPARPAGRRLLLVGIAASASRRWAGGRGHRAETVAVGLLDDVAYGTGVWRGLRPGGLAAVLPSLVAWPGRRRPPAGDLTGR